MGVYAGEGERITVFAAASTTQAVTEITRVFMEKGEGRVVLSFASSSTLAKQIDMGAPTDIYISANGKWMDYLEKRGGILPESRFDLLGNRIVLIKTGNGEKPSAPGSIAGKKEGGGNRVGRDGRLPNTEGDHGMDTPSGKGKKRVPTLPDRQEKVGGDLAVAGPVEIDSGFPLGALLAGGRLAMGDPAHVPAGIYGKKALEKLGLWAEVRNAVAPARDVRAALALVERGEAPLGIVYSTDAAGSSRTITAGIFPLACHPPIVYPVALVKGRSNPVAARFLTFLKGAEARRLFESHGFRVR